MFSMDISNEDFVDFLADAELNPEPVDVIGLDGKTGRWEGVIYYLTDKDGDLVGIITAWKLVEPKGNANFEDPGGGAGSFDPGPAPAIGQIGAIQWFSVRNEDPDTAKEVMAITGLNIDPEDFIAGASDSNSETRYPFLVSLFDGDGNIKGSKFADQYMEAGEGGEAIVKGNKGNDTLWVWREKTIGYDGGDGKDTIRFEYQVGFDPQPAAGAVIDLAAGTGVNPHGGQITLKNVENVIGQFGASNDLRGDDNAKYLQSGTLADTLLGMGGNDSIYVKYNATGGARATEADGGVGTDTMTAELTYMEPFIGSGFDQKSINTLDLTNQANNTATFKGGTFENFEVFKAVQDFNTLFYFIGSDAGEKVYGTGYEDDFDGGGGNDLLAGGFAADELTGGARADKFWFRYATDSNAAGRDTVTDFSHAEHDRIDLSKIFGGKLDFLGSKNFSGHAGEVRVSSNGGDTLVEADTSGDKVADFALLLEGGPTVVAADFVL